MSPRMDAVAALTLNPFSSPQVPQVTISHVGVVASAVAMITGNGLKDVRSARTAVSDPFDVPPDGAGLEDI